MSLVYAALLFVAHLLNNTLAELSSLGAPVSKEVVTLGSDFLRALEAEMHQHAGFVPPPTTVELFGFVVALTVF